MDLWYFNSLMREVKRFLSPFLRQRQDSSQLNIESKSRFESLETYLIGLKERLKEDFGENVDNKNWLIGGPEATRIAGHLAGLDESSTRRLYEVVRNRRVFDFVESRTEEGITVLQLRKDQVLAAGAICYVFSKEYPDPKQPVKKWEDIFTKAKKSLNELHPELASLILDPRKPDVKFKLGSQQNFSDMQQHFFRHIDYENVADPGLRESLRIFQKSAQLRLGMTVGVNSAVELVGKCLNPNFGKESGTWLDGLFWECNNYGIVKLSGKNGKGSVNNMDDLYKFFILGWVNKRLLGFRKIGGKELTYIIAEAEIFLGQHRYAVELENAVKAAQFSSEQKSVESEPFSAVGSFKPDEETFWVLEKCDQRTIREALESLPNDPKGLPDSLDSIDCYVGMVPVARSICYILTVLNRGDKREFEHLFENLNINGFKKLLGSCLKIMSSYKIENLRQFYERTEKFKNSPKYYQPSSDSSHARVKNSKIN